MAASDHPSEPRQAGRVDWPSRALRRGGGAEGRDRASQQGRLCREQQGGPKQVGGQIPRSPQATALPRRRHGRLARLLQASAGAPRPRSVGPWHWHHPNEIDGPSNQLPSSSRKRRRGNMEKDAVLVCMVLGFLGSVAVTLGFVANNYSSKSVQYNGTNCVYRSPPATGLGILGVFLVFINQVIVAAYASGWCLCLCCCCPCWTKHRRLAPTPSKWNPRKEPCEPSWMGLRLDL
ncbi:uncharacterized protein LOC119312719 isoform X4 [Triticum dicoccoides]|uniref:uncharacterized protein LOC119312719 isoform X4 n=1 Tax=Triticum dicoccoides TaxID=85692 RepID=UPI001890D428|nr:uncharacterized protein LOC119312719 isoform X4 [Triticum dicoccoides]